MNLIVIKEEIKNVIDLLEQLIEESGMDGDIDLVGSLQVDLELFQKINEEIKHFSNSEIFHSYVVHAIKEHIPIFNEELFSYYIGVNKDRKEALIAKIQAEIDNHTNLINVLAEQYTVGK